MDDEAEAGRELERLQAELTEFVVEAVAARMTSGEQPQLARALVEAIDRRVDQAVDAKVSGTRWPDPEEFADQVLAAAARRGGPGGGDARSRGTAKSSARRGNNLLPFALGFATALGIALVAWLVYSALQRPAPVQTNPAPVAPIENGVVPTSEGPVNVLIEGPPAPANQQAPGR